MKKIIITALTILSLNTAFSQIYKGKEDATTVSFFSKNTMEDIDAVNKKATFVMNTSTGDIQAAITMTFFKFKSPLMEEHFNENYVESEKYPTSVFKGKVAEKIDLTKDGVYKVNVTGKLTLHGVTKDVTIPGTLTKKGNEIIIDAKFKVKLADYQIKVPSLYVQTIAEEIDVTVNSVMEPFVKK